MEQESSMAVFRVNKSNDYTILANGHFRDRAMSLKAKGLLSLMLSLPDDWDYSINGLVALSKDGINSVKAALHELKEFGYVTIDESRAGGKYGYTYNIYESPDLRTAVTEDEKPSTVNGATVNRGGETDDGFTEAVNQRQLNTNISNTKESNTKRSNIQIKYFDDPETDEAFASFIAERKERGKKMTPRAINMAVKKLNDLSEGSSSLAVQIINQSILNGWNGFFPLSAAGRSQKRENIHIYDEWRRAAGEE